MTAVDVSADALALAAENAEPLGLAGRLRLLASDWFAGLAAGERFDLIVANPPYLSDAETAAAAPEVREHEPRVALSAGADGLAELGRILAGAPVLWRSTACSRWKPASTSTPPCAPAAARVWPQRVAAGPHGRDRYLFAWRT